MFFYLSLVTYQYLAFVDIVNTVLVFFNHHLTTGQWSSPSSIMKGCSLIVISATRTKAYKRLEHNVHAWVRSTLPVNVPRNIKNPFFERVVLPIKTDSGPILVKRHLALACENIRFSSLLAAGDVSFLRAKRPQRRRARRNGCFRRLTWPVKKQLLFLFIRSEKKCWQT